MPTTDAMPTTDNDKLTQIEQDIECQQVEESIIDRVPELKRLNADIEKATTLLVNAVLVLESSIRLSKQEELEFEGAVIAIKKKIDTINEHIGKVLEDAPNKLTVSVKVNDADWQKIQEMFEQHRHEVETTMQKHLREVNYMFEEERRKVQKRYKEYDGCYLGYRVQWFIWFFFTIGLVISSSAIIMAIGRYFRWF